VHDDSRCKNPRWDPVEQDRFLEHLDDAADSYERAECVLTKAAELYGSRDPERISAALSLLLRALDDWRDEDEVAEVWLRIARCHVALDHEQEALEAFRHCFHQEDVHPQVQTTAWAEFAALVMRKNRHDLYDLLLEILDRHLEQEAFWLREQELVAYVARAVIADHQGLRALARKDARLALRIAAQLDGAYADLVDKVRPLVA
jgi:tetratricopeptide (TPR) repeat protein